MRNCLCLTISYVHTLPQKPSPRIIAFFFKARNTIPMSNMNEAPSLVFEALQILNRWKVDNDKQINLLNLPDMHPRMLKRLRRGDQQLQEDHDMLERMRCIFEIDHSLQQMFPHNGEMADYWVTTPNLQLQEQTPLDVMLAHGTEGMQTVTQQLNGANCW